MTDGLFPFDSKKSKIQCTLRGGCSKKSKTQCTLRGGCSVGTGHWDVPGFSSGSHGMGARWDGEQGTGSALRPSLQVLSLLFCLNGSAALNVVHNLQPTAEPPQSLCPGCPGRNPSFPPHPRSFCSRGMQRCCAPSRTHQGVPAPTAPLLNENTIGSLLVLLPTAPRADTSQRRVRRERGWMGMGLMPSCHTGSGITFY